MYKVEKHSPSTLFQRSRDGFGQRLDINLCMFMTISLAQDWDFGQKLTFKK